MPIRSPYRSLADAAFGIPVRSSHAWLSLATVAAAGVAATCAFAAAPQAEKSAGEAQAALARGKTERAIAFAEAAVAADPRNAAYRVTLGDAYLRNGRFESARQAYEEALQLGNDKGRTALALALMQVAQGQYAQASDTLSAYRDSIPAGDYGLALALAGQTSQGVAVLADAVRSGENTPKIRQNLAYAFALDGKWPMARAMVEQDLPADKVDARLNEWALTNRPEDARKRVAMLLGTPLRGDSGMPAALALAAHGDGKNAAAEPAKAPQLARAATTELPPLAAPSNAPVVEVSDRASPSAKPAAPAPIDPNADAPAVLQNIKVQAAAPAPAPKPVHIAVPAQAAVGKPAEIKPVVARLAPVQAQPKPAAKLAQAKTVAQPTRVVSGGIPVQLGAFATPEGAKRAIAHYTARHSTLGGHKIDMVKVTVNNKTYWRVLASGFAGHSAAATCHAVTARGGACLVRADLAKTMGQAPVAYARNGAKPVQPAQRPVAGPSFARRK